MNRAGIILFILLFSNCKADKKNLAKNEFKGYNQKIEMYIPDSLKFYKHIQTDKIKNQSFGKFYKWVEEIVDGLSGKKNVIKAREEVISNLLIYFENGQTGLLSMEKRLKMNEYWFLSSRRFFTKLFVLFVDL